MSDADVFDPETFLDNTTEGANDTTYTPVPEGEYQAVIDTVGKPRRETSQKTGNVFTVMDITWMILDPQVKEIIGGRDPKVRQSIFLETTPDASGKAILDMGKGKNIPLGRIRAAVNMNHGSFRLSMLNGAGPAIVVVSHRPNPKQPGDVFSEVSAVRANS